MKRPRVRTFERIRSTNPVTNIISHRTGALREKTTTNKLLAIQVNTSNINITPLRTQF